MAFLKEGTNVAHHIGAFKKAINLLCKYYKKL